jgi:hypothetical protein
LNGNSLEAHDLRTGVIQWVHDSDAAVVSANDHAVVVSEPDATVADDMSGSRLWAVPFGVAGDGGAKGLLVGRESVFVVTSPGSYKSECTGR